MSKLVGFVPMKKTEGKVLFVVDSGKSPVVGQSTDKIFLYGDVSRKINENCIGHDIVVQYMCGYNGKAYVTDVTIK